MPASTGQNWPAGGTPNFPTSRCMAASALHARLRTCLRLSLRVSAEPSHTPSYIVASLAKCTCWPTWMGLHSLRRPWPRRLEKRTASVFAASDRMAFPSAHLILSAAQLSNPLVTSSMLLPSTNHVTSFTKEMPLAPCRQASCRLETCFTRQSKLVR